MPSPFRSPFRSPFTPGDAPPSGPSRRSLIVAVVASLIAALVILAPLVLARELPLLDVPNHLGAVAIWLHHDDPAWGFGAAYVLDLRPVPYWTYLGAVRLVAEVLPLRLANEVVVGALLCALPAALAFALARHRRSPWLALVAVPLAWSYDVALGFLSYVLGLALLCVALGTLRGPHEDPAAPWSNARLAGNAALGVLIYFSHPLAFLLWLLVVAIWAPRRAALLATPGLVLFALALITAPGRTGEGLPATFAARWLGPLATLRVLPVRILDFVGDGWQVGLLALLVGTLGALAIVLRRAQAATPGGARHDDRRPWLLALALALGCFALPEHLYRPINWWQLSGRLPLVLALILPLCLPRGRLGRAGLLLAPLCLATVAYVGAIVGKFRAFDRRADDFHAVVAALPMAPKVLTLVYPPLGDPAVRVHAWREFPSYVQVARGGFNPWSWPDGFPMRTRPEAKVVAPSGHHPETFTWEAHAAPWDWFLVRNPPAGLFEGRPVIAVASRGAWTLWRKALTPQ